ncbi:hypothetical protein WISP_41356 [Willisornis vidua]|uniref:Uncharacterized protein n=1 Tax=Willisornis vidua TaxID=1566151 RepID=A0ABQ9DJM8_9PASS|nr:hypothetical protein WISP_41356 [Willisornis vidua]
METLRSSKVGKSQDSSCSGNGWRGDWFGEKICNNLPVIKEICNTCSPIYALEDKFSHIHSSQDYSFLLDEAF